MNYKTEDLLKILGKNWINEGYKSKDHEFKSLETAKKILSNYYKNNFDSPLLEEIRRYGIKIV